MFATVLESLKRRVLSLVMTAVFSALLVVLSDTEEYFRHREAVISAPSADSFSRAWTGAPVTESGGALSGSSIFAPDAAAEKSETVLIGPDPEIKKRLLALISESEKELLVNIYLLTEPSVTAALVAAENRWIEVRVILEKDPYGLPNANRTSRDRLLQSWADVFSSRDDFAFTHAKYAVSDGKRYVFSTGNYTKSTFEKNREIFVFGNDAATAEFLRTVFESDFDSSPFVGPVPGRMYLAPVDARRKITSFVSNSKESVTVFAPSVSDDEFVAVLNRLAKEGKKVRVCLLKDASVEDLARFAPEVRAVRSSRAQLHLKTVLSDRRALLVGSANFTENSIDRNREVGAVFSDRTVIRNYENTVLRDCKW